MEEADKILKAAETVLNDNNVTRKPYDYYTAKILYFLKMDQENEGIKLFHEAREQHPNLIGDHDFGYMLMNEGKYQECIDFVDKQKLNEISEMNYYHWYMLSSCYGGLGQFEKALEFNEMALIAFERYGDYDNEMNCKMKFVKQKGDILYVTKQYEKADRFLMEEIERFQEDEDCDCDSIKYRLPFLYLKSLWIKSKSHVSDCDNKKEMDEMRAWIKDIIDKLSNEDNSMNRSILSNCMCAAENCKIDIYKLILSEKL